MPRSVLPVNNLLPNGVSLLEAFTAVNSTDGDSVAVDNAGRTMVIIRSASLTVNVTLDTPGTRRGEGIASGLFAVVPGSQRYVPMLPVYRQSDGTYHLDYDTSTGVDAMVVKMGRL